MKKEVPNEIAKTLDATEGVAKYDECCKKVLSFKKFLAYIIKQSTVEFKKYSVDEIADKYIEGEPYVDEINVHRDEITNDEKIDGINSESTSVNERTVRYDIIFYAVLPKNKKTSKFTINIEVQNTYYDKYPMTKRMVYYASRLLCDQHTKEQKNENYRDLHKVFSIWVCTDVEGSKRNSVTRFSLAPENVIGKAKFKKENYDLLEIIVIGLGDDKESEDYKGVIKFLDVLLSKTMRSEEKKNIIKSEYGINMTKQVERSVTDMCSLGMGIYLKASREARKEGKEEGRKEGKINTYLNNIKKIMEKFDYTAEQAMNVLDLSEEEKAIYSKLLK
jgi:predicted transposase/invertase (TIGR01784 family)